VILVASSWLADTMRSRTSSGFAYREKIPSRLSTASPPSRPISIARVGPTTPSIAAAMIGSSKRWPQSSHEMSTSFGLSVTVPGTSAMSSNPYATLAFRPRPTHIPIGSPPLSPPPVPRTRSLYIGIGATPSHYISCEYTRRGRHRSEEHTSELQSQSNLVCRLLLEKKKHTPLTTAVAPSR